MVELDDELLDELLDELELDELLLEELELDVLVPACGFCDVVLLPPQAINMPLLATTSIP
jgi:hypothetical protein